MERIRTAVRTNVDKGNQSSGGPAATAVGNIANGAPCAGALPAPSYVLLSRAHTHGAKFAPGDDASLWLLVGTDQGYESTTAVYCKSITVERAPAF